METLPRTASPMPMFGLAGILALGAGMALRALGRN
jgi:LPXTG-motif cell wall-anchored protein